MLCLTRRTGESIQIGDGIKVTILSSQFGKVSVGIIAPKETLILRSELIAKNGGYTVEEIDRMYLEADSPLES